MRGGIVRVSAFIDGFNLYDAIDDLVCIPVKFATHSGFNLPPFEPFLFTPLVFYRRGRFGPESTLILN